MHRGNISGLVTGQKSGKPLIGASVVIIGTNFGAASDNNGKFVIQNIKQGNYKNKISYMYYKSHYSDYFKVTPDSTSIINIKLYYSSSDSAKYYKDGKNSRCSIKMPNKKK